MLRGATFDRTGLYRYRLWREWDRALPTVAFIMLNPSTADADHDDPTIRRCIGFARAWGFGRLEVVNLFAYRAPTPRELFSATDPVGTHNITTVQQVLRDASCVVLAWGNHGARAGDWRRTLLPFGWCLGLTTLGEPRHPLYVAGTAMPLHAGPTPCERDR